MLLDTPPLFKYEKYHASGNDIMFAKNIVHKILFIKIISPVKFKKIKAINNSIVVFTKKAFKNEAT